MSGRRAVSGAPTDGNWYLPAHDVTSALTKDGPLIPKTAEEARNDRPEYYHDTKQGWRVTIHTKSSCAFLPGLEVLDYPECDAFNDAVLDLVDERDPDLVAFAPNYNEPVSPTTPAEQDRVIDDLLHAGAGHVAVLWESPGLTLQTSAVDCLDEPPANYQECTYHHEPGGIQVLNEAARTRALDDDRVSYVDLEPWVCPDNILGACPGVIGGVQVTGIGSHLTTSCQDPRRSHCSPALPRRDHRE